MRIALLGAPATGKTRLAQALTQHLNELHVSDAPPLAELQAQPFDRILLTGLDLPGSTPEQQAADAALRAALQQMGLSYGVIYGEGGQRLRAALRLIHPQEGPAPRWRGLCEKCADPDCEFRLFTALQSSTAADRPPA
jgi:hypothetical protein